MKHLEVAHTVVDFLHKSFPDASLHSVDLLQNFFLGKTVILIFCL
jgi:hypothetical protein